MNRGSVRERESVVASGVKLSGAGAWPPGNRSGEFVETTTILVHNSDRKPSMAQFWRDAGTFIIVTVVK